MTKIDPADLLDANDVAGVLGLSHREAVSVYRRRYADFPAPLSGEGVRQVRALAAPGRRGVGTRDGAVAVIRRAALLALAAVAAACGTAGGDEGTICQESGRIAQMLMSDADGMEQAITRARTTLAAIEDPDASPEVFYAAANLVMVASSLELYDGLPANNEDLLALLGAARGLESACGY